MISHLLAMSPSGLAIPASSANKAILSCPLYHLIECKPPQLLFLKSHLNKAVSPTRTAKSVIMHKTNQISITFKSNSFYIVEP